MSAASTSGPVDQLSASELQDADALMLQVVRFGRLTSHAKARFMRKSGHEAGVETAAFVLLAHLVNDGPRRATALAESVHTDTSTVSRQVAALVRHGLVERRADPQDGRACLLAATDEGERTFQAHRQQRNAEIACLVSGWPREDVRRLVELLDRLNTVLENYEPSAPWGDGPPVRHDRGESR